MKGGCDIYIYITGYEPFAYIEYVYITGYEPFAVHAPIKWAFKGDVVRSRRRSNVRRMRAFMRMRSHCVVMVMDTASCARRFRSGPSCEFKTHLTEN